MTTLLTATGLACARGGVQVLDGIDLELAAGSVLVLRGPNGIGKTTLLRVLAGLQPPLAGQLAVPPGGVAYAGHADGLKATLSVRENLVFWARVFGQREVGPALAAFDLEGLAGRAAQHLSAGQKRRLGLARLMVTGRAVWLLDEPTVSLDTSAIARFAQAVRSHCADGGAALIATHADLGLDAPVLDLSRHRAATEPVASGFDEAFV